MDLKEEHILGEGVKTHWYYVSKGRALCRMLKGLKPFRSILDIGAGSGVFTRQLLDSSDIGEAMCVDIAYAKDHEEEYNGKRIEFKKGFSHSDADLVLLMDVIEHIEDDESFIKEIASKVDSGTHFLVTVPAFQFLFSGHDMFLEHYRRYSLPLLEKTLSAAGLKIIKTRYFFGLMFPAVAVMRILAKIRMKLSSEHFKPQSELKMHSRLMNTLLTAIHRFELLLFRFNRIAGLTLFSVAVKN